MDKTTFLDDDDQRPPPVMLFGVNLRADSSSTTTAYHDKKNRIIREFDFFDQEKKGPSRIHILPPLINTPSPSPLKEIIFPQIIIMPSSSSSQEIKTTSKAAATDNYDSRCDSESSSFLDHDLKRSTAAGIDDQKKRKEVADDDDDDSIPTRRNHNDGRKVIRLFGVDICVDSSATTGDEDDISEELKEKEKKKKKRERENVLSERKYVCRRPAGSSES